MQTVVSVYPSCKANIAHNDVTLQEVFDKVKNDSILRQRTEDYRKALEARLPEKQLKELKSSTFPIILPAVRCEGGRKSEHVKEYTFLCQADFDNLPLELLPEMKRRLRELKFVLMYYVSMSGRGLHVLYAYAIPNSGFTPDVYLQAFRQGNTTIANAIVATYDAKVETPVHPTSLCHDPEAWCNPEAEPLRVDMSLGMKKAGKEMTFANKEVIDEDKWPARWNADNVYALAKSYVEKSSTGEFAHGNRNNYLVHLAMLLSDFGMFESNAARLMEQEFSGLYGEESIPSLVHGCYLSDQKMFGRKPLPSSDGKKSGREGQDKTKINVAADFLRRQKLRYDVISRKIIIDGKEMTDRHFNSLLLSCNMEAGRDISPQVFRAAMMSDCVEEYNPITEYLNSLDLTPFQSDNYDSPIDRVSSMVHVSASPLIADGAQPLGAQVSHLREPVSPQDLWRMCFRKWFVAMVASWIRPEVVNHQMIVLIGKQGIYKSTWLDALIPPQLSRYRCRQSSTDFGSKDEQLRCTEFCLINLDEFDRLRNTDLDQLKSLITSPDTNLRVPYGTNKERRVRIGSYCASGNKLQFLTDQTGNRRFLPFYVTDILSPFAHPLPYDEMYAEAMWLINNTNFSYWFSLDEINDMSGYVEQFADSIAEDELIDVYYDVPRSDPDNPETRPVLFLTPSEILAKLTLWGNIKKPISIRKLNVILDRKGFPRARNGSKGTRGYLVVELDSATVNSNRIQTIGPTVF